MSPRHLRILGGIACLAFSATLAAGPMADEVRRLLQQGADPNERFEYEGNIGYPIYLYIKPGRDAAEAVRILLEAGADPNAADHDGWTPLHFAAQEGAVQVLETLLAAKADPNRKAKDGATPLHLAMRHGELGRLAGAGEDSPQRAARMVSLLLAAGADAELPDPEGNRPVERAIEHGSVDVLRALLDGGVPVDGERGAALLEKAAGHIEPRIVHLLLDAGAPIPPGLLARTISSASAPDRIVSARLLLDHGADPAPGPGKHGTDALTAAVIVYASYGSRLEGLTDLIARLVDLGADPRPALRQVQKMPPRLGQDLVPLLRRHLPGASRADTDAARKALAPILAELTALTERRLERWSRAQKAAFEAMTMEGLDRTTLPERLARLEDYAEACEGFRVALEGFPAAAEARARARGLDPAAVAAARELAAEAARAENLDLLAELAAHGIQWSKAAGAALRALAAMKPTDALDERVRQAERAGKALRDMTHYERLSNALIDGGARRKRLRAEGP